MPARFFFTRSLAEREKYSLLFSLDAIGQDKSLNIWHLLIKTPMKISTMSFLIENRTSIRCWNGCSNRLFLFLFQFFLIYLKICHHVILLEIYPMNQDVRSDTDFILNCLIHITDIVPVKMITKLIDAVTGRLEYELGGRDNAWKWRKCNRSMQLKVHQGHGHRFSRSNKKPM